MLNKKIFTAIAFSAILLTSLTTFAATNFSDTSDSPYKTGIEILRQSGVVEGDEGKNTFRPDDGINRAEITKIIVYANTDRDLDEYNTECFSDIKKNQWYTEPICFAKSQDWVKGYPDGTFKPAQNVTNFEGMKIAANASDIDFTEGDPWYADLVDILSEDNLIPYTVSKPHAELTRAEMADLIVRITKLKESKSALKDYLGSRDDIVVTLDTIEAKINLSTLDSVEVCADQASC